ncbi:hypothetical protein BC351_14290 [Paenibacillus ferrarius]|uniref:Glycosyl hydrolase family 95 N-terminal domain-containing protein n=1 Tax=Paenibacillus ferrarius TaxID=1469647 RepID=A0A1V4H693_9BACL|nr:glycoside hydrolase family 95 protein [Paenibacillus ferrarius]OPH46652.1 hypothetical protein BC351_14290 [Paenibacillus ferrarius]
MDLTYKAAAKEWTEALPVGNGRLGAMIFGGVEKELLQLNEDTLWSGPPKDWNNPQAKELLPEVRQLLYEGRFLEADQLSRGMLGPNTQSYLPLGDLHLQFDHGMEFRLESSLMGTLPRRQSSFASDWKFAAACKK